jgi:Planctomycete cytochrome C
LFVSGPDLLTAWVHRLSPRVRVAVLLLAPILLLFVLLLFFAPNGTEGGAWAQFIGRFHPLAVHLPIALILLLPLLELAGRTQQFAHLRGSVPFVLGLAILTEIAASLLGWILARNGGYSGPLVTQHLWGGFLLIVVSSLCWVSHGREGCAYPITLVACLGLVAFTGYRGGQLSLGEDHLTEYMPGRLRKVLWISGASAENALVGKATFYGVRIQPILAGHCTSCHGPSKQRSGLRLDAYASLMRGGKHGAVIKPGDPRGSELFRRITLPPSHDDFMPKEGKQPLSGDQIALIEMWIAAGASRTQSDLMTGPGAQPAIVTKEVKFEEIDFAAVAKKRAGIEPILAGLQKRFPNILEYESRGSADLLLNASLLGQRFGDDDLAALTPLLEHIVMADFSRTAITDRSAVALAAMKRLRVLRLMDTKVTDATVQSLAGLDQLESLSVFHTGVTAGALPALARLPKLQRVYAGETAISITAALPGNLKDKIILQ